MSINKNLKDIANILRRDVLEMTTIAGSGHPTSCFSCAEIISCLFFYQMKFDFKNPDNPNNDEFILSKGHAVPILYSALYRLKLINELSSLRKLNSPLEGHPMPRSIPWIKVATGSLGQGLSIGVGMSFAAKIQKRKFKTYVLLGDGELAEGSIYEALQIASHYNLNNLIAIVDVNRLSQTGETIYGHNIKKYKKRFISFGWNVFTINGHKINQIIKSLLKAEKSSKPTIILAKTLKGKGFSKRIEDKNGWHGKALSIEEMQRELSNLPNPQIPKITVCPPKEISFKPKIKKYSPNLYRKNDLISTREAYGNALSSLAKSDSSVIIIDADVSNSTYSGKVKEKTPQQFIEAFIAEQNMIGMSLGMSKKDLSVFASSFGAFLTRAHDQIRMSSFSKPNFTICGSHAGVSIGEDGASQMGLTDIAMFRSMPNSIIFYPSDAVSTEKIIQLCYKIKGLKYVRTTRGALPIIYPNSKSFSLGGFNVLKSSFNDKIVLIGSGITLHESLKASSLLKLSGINSSVIDLYCIKPLNKKSLISFIKSHGKKVIITEDHFKEGGIGEMLSSILINEGIIVKHLCIDNQIPHSGNSSQLLKKYKISARHIELASRKILRK